MRVTNAFASKGYKVALAAKDGVGEGGFLRLNLDLSKPEDVVKAFGNLTEKLGVPTVVIYNGTEIVLGSPANIV